MKGLEDKDVYAFGDCATPESNILPATAQVADREGIFLAKYLNAKATHSESSIDPFRKNIPT